MLLILDGRKQHICKGDNLLPVKMCVFYNVPHFLLSDISQEVQFIFPLGGCKIRYHEKASVSLENIQGDTENAFINGTGVVQIINLGQGLHHEGQAIFIILYDTHLGNGFYAGLHKQLQLVKAVAFLVVALYIQVADGFNWRCHAFMSGQQYDVDFFVESSDFLHHLISANGRHQEIQQQDIVFSVSYLFNCLIRVIHHIYVIAGALEIGLQRGCHDIIVIQRQDSEIFMQRSPVFSHFPTVSPFVMFSSCTSLCGMETPTTAPPAGLSSVHMVPPNFPLTTASEI